MRQGPSESLLDYLVWFNKATIRVVPIKQEISIGAFHTGIKMGYFNESLAQKPSFLLAKVVTIEECYIKGKESNPGKKA